MLGDNQGDRIQTGTFIMMKWVPWIITLAQMKTGPRQIKAYGYPCYIPVLSANWGLKVLWWNRKWVSGYFLRELTAGWNGDAQPTSWMSCFLTINIRLLDPWRSRRQLCGQGPDSLVRGRRHDWSDYNALVITHCNFRCRILRQWATHFCEIYLKPRRACWS